MKKIDLHIHTVSTPSDRHFVFSMAKLEEYVQATAIDCIAITNHNIFDRPQFEIIKAKLVSTTVLPGIELDLDGGQILLIADGNDLDDFYKKCQELSSRSPTKKDPISVRDLQSVFGNLSKYILIPHYEKRPQVSSETLAELRHFITAGEVASPKKFIHCIKDDTSLVPVYFSDSRMEDCLASLPVRQTYLDCDDMTFGAVRVCLRDKHKVKLSATEGNSTFQIFDDGQVLSTGLNVIIGERSSGKSHTLKRIAASFENAKHIPQFSLVAQDEDEDERRFSKWLGERNSILSREYLHELQLVVQDVVDIDLDEDARAVSRYVRSLTKFARESEMHDAFSSASLFSEEEFPIQKQKGLKDLINSVQNLIENVEFKTTIEKYISVANLRRLIIELMREYGRRDLEARKRKWLNDLIREIKARLQFKTAATPVSDIDFYDVAMNLQRIAKFETIVRHVRREREIIRKPLHAYEIVATTADFRGAGDLKRLSRTTKAFSAAFQEYASPYRYLQKLKEIDGVEEADLYKYFVNIEYTILNKEGFEVSGGERSEFNLLEEIQDARKYDMLLIDEPESSFDNLFLKGQVNEIIKEISQTMPVVLVTHNNTVGASIRPDYLLYTTKAVLGAETEYRIYSGFPGNKRLRSMDGKCVSTWEVMLGCLEAGDQAYEDRRKDYEDIKD